MTRNPTKSSSISPRNGRHLFRRLAFWRELRSCAAGSEVETLVGDRYAYNFAREILRPLDLGFLVSEKTTSECFGELLPMLNAHEVELPQHQVLLAQLGSLECKPSSRGKTFYGHPTGAHDDVAAATAICVTHCALSAQYVPVSAAAAGPHGSSFMTIGPDGKAIITRHDGFDHTAARWKGGHHLGNSSHLGKL